MFFIGTSGSDQFIAPSGPTGGFNAYLFAPANLSASDIVIGSVEPAALDLLFFYRDGTIEAETLSQVSGIERIILSGSLSTIELTDALAAGSAAGLLSVAGRSGDDTVDATRLTAEHALAVDFSRGGGTDTFLGSAASETVTVSAASFDQNDTLVFGAGSDRLILSDSGVLTVDVFAGVSGLETLQLLNGGTVSLGPGLFEGGVGMVLGGDGSEVIDASAVDDARLLFITGSGVDELTGGTLDDEFVFALSSLRATDRVAGGDGADTLSLTGATLDPARLSGVSEIEVYRLTSAGSFAIGDANLAGISDPVLRLEGSTGADNISGSAVTDPLSSLLLVGRGGEDTLTAGAGDDVIELADAGFASADGGDGFDVLRLGGAGQTLDLAGRRSAVDGIESIDLSDADGATLVLDRLSVLAVTGSAQTLRVLGGSDDALELLDSWALAPGTVELDGVSFRQFSNGNATLFVETSIDLAEPALTYQGQETGIESTAEGMIALRMQNHMVQTADGNHHLLANLGNGSGLVLSSSSDGVTWIEQLALPGTSRVSTADFMLAPDGSYAAVVYTETDDSVHYQRLDYAGGVWSAATGGLIHQDSVQSPAHPTVAIDPGGALWATIIVRSSEPGSSFLPIYASTDGGATWTLEDTLGTDFTSNAIGGGEPGSAKIVATPSALHIVYTFGNALFAATSEYDGNWDNRLLQTYASDQPDPFRSHFSVAADGEDVHIATNNGARDLVHLSYDGQAGIWSAPKLVDSASASYMQISISDEGDFYLVANDTVTGALEVFESDDGGDSFDLEARLVYEPLGETGNPRMETAPEFSGDLLVLQQISDSADEQQSLVSYQVDVDAFEAALLI